MKTHSKDYSVERDYNLAKVINNYLLSLLNLIISDRWPLLKLLLQEVKQDPTRNITESDVFQYTEKYLFIHRRVSKNYNNAELLRSYS